MSEALVHAVAVQNAKQATAAAPAPLIHIGALVIAGAPAFAVAVAPAVERFADWEDFGESEPVVNATVDGEDVEDPEPVVDAIKAS